MQEYYTTKEAAKILKIKIRTLRSWISSGKLKVFRFNEGRRLYISRDELIRVMGREFDV